MWLRRFFKINGFNSNQKLRIENQTKAAAVSAAKSEPGAFVFNVNVGRAIFISSGRPQ